VPVLLLARIAQQDRAIARPVAFWRMVRREKLIVRIAKVS
jgi:hypothetical protein